MYFKHTKRLIGALAVSGFVNIMLLTSIFYWTFKERSPSLYCEQKPAYKQLQQAPLIAEETSRRLIQQMKALSYDQLVGKLKSTIPVENGYAERDLALASLVDFHRFDLSRALGSSSFTPQERSITYGRSPNGSSMEIKIYPGLSETHFASIISFATSERWPQTPQGLFLLLQRNKGSPESSLLDAFYMTPEFLAMEQLFRRNEFPDERAAIASLLVQGDWKLLSHISEQQRLYGDLSDSLRLSVLQAYVNKGSIEAANRLLEDKSFSVQRLNDANVLSLLDVLTNKTPQSEKFAMEVLQSPRSDAVRKMAAVRLYAYAGEMLPNNFHYPTALQRFVSLSGIPQTEKLAKPPVICEPKVKKKEVIASKPLDTIKKMAATKYKADRLYIIQEGDTLWKLSRRFNVDVNVLKSYNKLSSNALTPGSALRIPSTL
jgi:hypothetical protein